MLTQKVIEDLCKHIGRGMSLRDSATLCRLATSTVENWITKGREQIRVHESGKQDDLEFGEKNSLLMELVRRVEQTREEFKKKLYGVALKQAIDMNDGKLAINLLARKWPKEFGRKDLSRNSFTMVNLTQARIIDSTGAFSEVEFE